jgi:hypothetical protein
MHVRQLVARERPTRHEVKHRLAIESITSAVRTGRDAAGAGRMLPRLLTTNLLYASVCRLCASVLPLGHCVVAEAGCNWYRLDINIYSLSKNASVCPSPTLRTYTVTHRIRALTLPVRCRCCRRRQRRAVSQSDRLTVDHVYPCERTAQAFVMPVERVAQRRSS